MNLPRFAVRYPVTISMLMLGIAILGVISFNRLGTDLLPAIYNPRIVVELESGDRSPQEMEQRFARQLEGELGTINRVVDITTHCAQGRIRMVTTFSWGTDMDFALLDVQKKVSRYEANPDVTRLTIARFNPQAEPIAIYALQSSDEIDLDELRRISENLIKRTLERHEGVARVQVYGGVAREVRVVLDEYLLASFQLTAAEVSNKIRQANVDASGGRLVQDGKGYLIKGIGKYQSIDDIGRTVVGYKTPQNSDSAGIGQQQNAALYSPGRVPLYLSEVADIEYGPGERTDLVRLQGKEAVALYIYKEAQENTVRVAAEVRELIDDLARDLPAIDFIPIYNQASFINQSIAEVKTTALIGILLAVLILYAFLRNIGVTALISLAIPISVLATFSLMFFQNLTLNVMTLGGLALGAGMLVDNAIVVIENIFRRRQQGEDAVEAAVAGTSEVGVAIVASTLTTIIVFLPIVYVRGIAAELFREQAWVVAFSLLSSLLVAFLLIPSLAARVLARDDRAFARAGLHLPFYERALQWALHNRKTVIGGALLLIVAALLLLSPIGAEFIPRSTEKQVRIDLELPVGTTLETSAKILAGVETEIEQLVGEQVARIFSTINVRSSQDLFSQATQGGEHRAAITLLLAENSESVRPEEVMTRLQQKMQLPNVHLGFEVKETSLQQTIGSGQAPVALELRGPELPALRSISRQLAAELQELGLLRNMTTSYEASRPEIKLEIDRLVAASFGLDVQQIAQLLHNRLSGEVVSDIFNEGEDRNIRLLFQRPELRELQEMQIETPSGAVVRLADIAHLRSGEVPREILRHNQSRVARITAHLQEGIPLSRAVARVQSIIKDYPLPSGYDLRFTGEEASRQRSFTQLKFALLLSIVLVYMVLASLFESFLHPFIILLTLPLAGVGSVLAFFVWGEPFSVMAYIGVIMLAGIAANDSIVLIDYINRLRAAGQPRRQAIVQAARDRLRPILMTSATTILALLPLTLGIGEGARLRAPMAVAVIGGLVTSTILTLLVIPVVYEALDGLKKE